MVDKISQKLDPYNWAFPQRNDLMSLSIIQNIKPQNQGRSRAISQDYRYIEPAKPTYYNKVSFTNQCNDIEGTKPKISLQNQIQNNTRVSVGMNVDDILGTRPLINKFQTKRLVNPLQPDYKLPTAIPAIIEQQKFIRDSMIITDIEGTKPKKDLWYNKKRNIDPYTEIDGSKPKTAKIFQNHVDSLNVADINGKVYLLPKQSNPLEPTYSIRGSSFGFVDGSKSITRHKNLNKDKSLSLNTDQIVGCQTNTVRDSFFLNQTRKDYPQSNKVSDIQGTQVGTYVRGIRTKRQSNPLNPSYNLAGI